MSSESFQLLVRPAEREWPIILDGWRWLVHGPVRPLAATLFGDPPLVRPGGEVQFLDTLEGELRTLAPFVAEMEPFLRSEQARELFMAEMAELLWAKGVRPGPDECYAYVVPLL